MPIDVIARGMAVAQARSFASNEPGKGAALIFTESGDSLQTVSELSLGIAPVLPSGGDDTAALQAALSTGCLILAKGASYQIAGSLTCPAYRCVVVGNGARLNVNFGSDYARPVFQNDKQRDVSHTLVVRDLVIRGNCVIFDFRYSSNNPGAGMKIKANCIDFNTLDGNQRQGTGLIIADQIDSLEMSNMDIINVDQVFQIGGGAERRDSTQLSMRQFYIQQVNGIGSISGVDKFTLEQVDAMTVGSGIAYLRSCKNIQCRQVHVEGIGAPGYSTAGGAMPAAAQGYAHYIANLIEIGAHFDQCKTIDHGGTGGTGKGSIYIGQASLPRLQNVRLTNCTFALAMMGSANWKAIVNRGRFKWSGAWPFTADVSLHAISMQYQDARIEDPVIDRTSAGNLLPGSTPLSLTDTAISGGGSPPTVSEVADGYSTFAGHSVTFNAAGYQMVKAVNVPHGWNTLIFEGRRTAGLPRLFAQQTGGSFSTFVDAVLVDGAGEDITWRLPFWNATPNQSIKIGFLSSATGDALNCTYIGLARGLHVRKPVTSAPETFASLPPPSNLWLGRQVIVRATGTADTAYICLRNAAGSATWVALG